MVDEVIVNFHHLVFYPCWLASADPDGRLADDGHGPLLITPKQKAAQLRHYRDNLLDGAAAIVSIYL